MSDFKNKIRAIPKTIWGTKIKDYRENKGFTIEEMATAVRIKYTTYTAYESGLTRNIPLDKLLTICNKLGVTPNDLLL